eukprot:2829216-Alexandrium_andersonii.AAC.1
MSASLVGSEMCIRDSPLDHPAPLAMAVRRPGEQPRPASSVVDSSPPGRRQGRGAASWDHPDCPSRTGGARRS